MPVFVAWLAQAFAALFVAFGKRTAGRIASIATATVVIAGLFAALLASVTAIVDGIAYAMPGDLALVGTWVIPDNLEACIAARLSAAIAIAIYKWQRDIAMAGAQA